LTRAAKKNLGARRRGDVTAGLLGAIEQSGLLRAGERVGVAVSGGADSVALLLLLRELREALGLTIYVLHFNHKLRGRAADGDEKFVARLAKKFALPFYAGAADVKSIAKRDKANTEDAARRERYVFFARATGEHELDKVAVAHTADDQAETVLLGLGRGSGPRSIAGMRAWRPPWGRPLLGLRRTDTEQTCRSAGLTPWQDPHNSNPAFTRVRVRREVLPLLDDVLGGGVRPALARTAELMAQDLDALDEIAGLALDQVRAPDGSLDIAALRRQPLAIVGRVLRDWAGAGGSGALTYQHLNRMTAQVASDDGPTQVRIPGMLDVIRAGGALRLRPH
jgi:tRNA(Ile)-lysidine synthase